MESQTNKIEVGSPKEFLINKDLLELILKQDIANFKLMLGTNSGDNYMSIMYSVEIQLKNSDKPKYILIKCYPNATGRRDYLDDCDAFGKEIFFYDKWAPALLEILQEAGVNEVISLAIPEILGANYKGIGINEVHYPDPWTKENFLAMTDLRKTNGYKMANRITGLDFDHINLAMKELATLHALSWCYKVKHGLGKLIKVFPQMREQMFDEKTDEQFRPLMESLVNGTLDMIEDVVGSDNPIFTGSKRVLKMDQPKLLREFLGENGVNEALVQSVIRIGSKEFENSSKDPWLVGCHGDFWLNNMLFKYDEQTKKPIHFVLLDLQMIREACPTTDLAYFFYSSTTLAVRKPNQTTFLETYYNQFVRVCEKLNCEPLPGFSLETLLQRFRRSKIFGFCVSIPILSVVLKPVEEAVELDSFEGNIADVFSNVMGGREGNVGLKTRFVEIATDLYEDGIL